MSVIVVWICGVILTVSAAGAVYRIAKGPSLMDRVMASDVLLTIVGAALALDMIYNKHLDNILLLAIISLIGFLGAVTVARNAGRSTK